MTDITAPLSDMDERGIAATELKAAEDKLQSLCAAHAVTFVAVERRGATLTASLKNLLDALDTALPQVEASKKSLELDGTQGKGEEKSQGEQEDTLSSLADKHRLRRRTLLQHSSLLELLELPSLMDACVRGHLYEEGLSISSFANTLERRHLMVSDGNENKTRNPIVDDVVNDVRRREGDLRRDLLNRLRSDVTMPQCLEIVTALRRLNGVELERRSMNHTAYSVDMEKIHDNMEWRLQVNFLEARDVWLEGNTSLVNNSSLSLPSKGKRGGASMKGRSEIILDGIDLYRTRCFEIATQFLAIFRSASTGSSTKGSKIDNHAYELFSMWTSRRIHTFLHDHVAARCLPLISDTAMLRDALESVTFFATSMGCVGADFSPMLHAIFEPCLVSIVTSHWADGLNVLQNTLKVCRDTGIASPLYSNREVASLADNEPSNGGQVDEYGSMQRSKTPAPPRQLLALPPLARLVNAFLVGLNDLRRCLLACAFPQLRTYFRNEFIAKANQVLMQNERAVLTPGFLTMKGEDAGKLRSVAVELKEEFQSCVEPYLTGALEVALGSFDSLPETPFEAGNDAVDNEEETNEEETDDPAEEETLPVDAELEGEAGAEDVPASDPASNEEGTVSQEPPQDETKDEES